MVMVMETVMETELLKLNNNIYKNKKKLKELTHFLFFHKIF